MFFKTQVVFLYLFLTALSALSSQEDTLSDDSIYEINSSQEVLPDDPVYVINSFVFNIDG